MATNDNIKQEILDSISEHINFALQQTVVQVRPRIITLLKTAIVNDPAWQSLMGNSYLGNDLQAHFGLRSSEVSGKLEEILGVWLEGVYVSYLPMAGTNVLKGRLIITAIRSSFNDVLSTQASNVVTDKGKVLPWLEWLLKRGDEVVIQDYHVVFKPTNRSRSGKALMYKTGRWNVPYVFAGTIDNNFITRLIDQLEEPVLDILEETFINNI